MELIWLTGPFVPDHKTIADFREDNGAAARRVCARFAALCRQFEFFAVADRGLFDGELRETSQNSVGVCESV